MLPQPQPFLLEQKHPLLPQRLEAIPNSPKGIPIGNASRGNGGGRKLPDSDR